MIAPIPPISATEWVKLRNLAARRALSSISNAMPHHLLKDCPNRKPTRPPNVGRQLSELIAV
jgi:hypothetical protein